MLIDARSHEALAGRDRCVECFVLVRGHAGEPGHTASRMNARNWNRMRRAVGTAQSSTLIRGVDLQTRGNIRGKRRQSSSAFQVDGSADNVLA